MQALTFYDADGATPRPGIELAQALGGAYDPPYRLGIRNSGDESWPETFNAYVMAIGSNDGWNMLRIGKDLVTLSPPWALAGALSDAGAGGVWTAVGAQTAAVSALNDNGETIASDPVSVTVDNVTETITWTWAEVPTATGYRLYGREGLIAELTGITSTEYEDDGATPAEGTAPVANTTGGALPTLTRHPVLLGAVPPGGWAFLYIARVVPEAVDPRLDPRIAGIRFRTL